jgi:hypothetical protein
MCENALLHVILAALILGCCGGSPGCTIRAIGSTVCFDRKGGLVDQASVNR